MPFDPTYSTYPGALVPTQSSGALVAPAGESDSGLPGSKELKGNVLSDFASPAYRKYPYPSVLLVPPSPPSSGSAEPSSPSREPISPGRSGERPIP